MTVYVESNFVLEIALGQEQAAAAQLILERATRGEISLAIPAFSLTEPFSTIGQRSRRLQQLRGQLKEQIRELARSYPHEDDVLALSALPARIASIEAREQERLVSTVQRLYDIAIVLPIDAVVYAEAMTIMEKIRLSPQDAMIYSSVLVHLRTSNFPAPHSFINKNWRDFSDVRIQAELNELDCHFYQSFAEAESVLIAQASRD